MRPRQQNEERTCFQEAGDFNPLVDSKADVAVVYGLNATFEERVDAWRKAGYRIHVMTGVAWGDYADYVRGEWDGTPHFDDAQTETGGFRVEHGISQGHDIYYMVPSEAYTRYLLGKLRRVVDAGALAIHLEEPEFWVRAGYGAGFEREWQAFYGEPWQDPISSPDARYRASKLMQHLYTQSLASLFAGLKEYAREKNNSGEKGAADFQCYVPTHSLINYAHWRIVSPESHLLAIPECDGVIGQVWTGTSRTPTVYRGLLKQRTFEAGYCEYAACLGMVRGTGKRLWQLADPIEDNPNFCWDDYRINWECTVTGSLLVEGSERFEIMPWPRRIFMRDYPTVNLDTLAVPALLDDYLNRLHGAGQQELEDETRRSMDLFFKFLQNREEDHLHETFGFARMAEQSDVLRFGDLWSNVNGFYKQISGWEDQQDAQRVRNALSAFYHNAAAERAFIPGGYATELQVVFNALADMDWRGEEEWICGQTGIGLAISDSLMFQRGEPSPSDADMSSLYGLALPLVKHGAAVAFVQLERVNEPGYLESLRVLFLSYEGQKPPSDAAHSAIVDWVKRGNALVVYGEGDAYNQVREWWNQNGLTYDSPQDHLTELAGLGRRPGAGKYACGKGTVLIKPVSPCDLAHDPQGAEEVMRALQVCCETLGIAFKTQAALAFRRGPYVAAAGMDEGSGEEPFSLAGAWINLFDPALAVVTDPVLLPDTRWLFYDLARCPETPWVIAAAGRVQQEKFNEDTLSFVVDGIAKTPCVVRARVTRQPTQVVVDGKRVDFEWNAASRTVLVRFKNDPQGLPVEIGW